MSSSRVGTVRIVIRALKVDIRPLRVNFRPLGLDFGLKKCILGPSDPFCIPGEGIYFIF